MSSRGTPQQSPKRRQDDSEPRRESPIIPPVDDTRNPESETIDLVSSEAMVIDSAEANHTGNSRPQVKTPEPRPPQDKSPGQRLNGLTERSPSTPGHLPPFDWDEFQARYTQALSEATQRENDLLSEFDTLSKYFTVWASAASVHDNERAIKRLQTRERYVKLEEQSLAQKKQHLTEVVRAFQSALALLSEP